MSSKDWGGVERYILDVSNAMRVRGHNVRMIARDYPKITRRFTDNDFRLVTAPLSKFIDIRTMRRLSHMIVGNTPAIIHVHTFREAIHAIFARKISRNPNVGIVVTRHIVKPSSNSWLNRYIYRNIDAVVFVSKLAHDTFFSTDPDIDRGKLRIIHNSVSCPSVGPIASYGGSSESFKVLFCGRICPEKGVDILIKALSLVNDADIIVKLLGDGSPDYVDSLSILAQYLGVSEQIRFLGYHEDVHPFINSADVVVCPSVVKEACPLSVLESMAHGKAVIASDNGGQAEFITSGRNGVLVPPGDTEKLAHAIAMLRNDILLRESLGLNAKTTFEKEFSLERFIDKIEDTYNAVIGIANFDNYHSKTVDNETSECENL